MTDIDTSDDTSSGKKSGNFFLRELREWGITLAIFIPVWLVFVTFLYELRSIPSESMVPSLGVGDRVAVNKFAYGYTKHSVPFRLGEVLPLGDGRVFARSPKHGDVAVFEHPHFERVMIKRVIGLPGDELQLRDKQLFVNGEPAALELIGSRRYVTHGDELGRADDVVVETYRETLPSGHSHIVEYVVERNGQRVGSRGVSPTFVVPDGHLFFLGDNRDRSADSSNVNPDITGHCAPKPGNIIDTADCDLRPGLPDEKATIGFVPMDNLIGRADTVLFTLDFCRDSADYECPPGRVWKGL